MSGGETATRDAVRGRRLSRDSRGTRRSADAAGPPVAAGRMRPLTRSKRPQPPIIPPSAHSTCRRCSTCGLRMRQSCWSPGAGGRGACSRLQRCHEVLPGLSRTLPCSGTSRLASRRSSVDFARTVVTGILSDVNRKGPLFGISGPQAWAFLGMTMVLGGDCMAYTLPRGFACDHVSS